MIDENMKNLIFNYIVTFILFFYGDATLPRNIVQNIIDHMDNLIKNIYLPCLKSQILKCLQKNIELLEKQKEINSIFESYGKILDDFNTEHKRFNILQEKGFSYPVQFSIGSSFVEIDINDSISELQNVGKHAVSIPLEKSLKLFLEKPDILDSILEYKNELEENKTFLNNFVQGSLWQNFYLKQEALHKKLGKIDISSITLPIIVYFDEFVAGNVLGPRAFATKFGAVYAFIACLPPFLASKLSSIIFSTLFYSKDIEDCGYNNIFSKLVAELNKLSTKGILVSVGGVTKRIFFQCVMIIGDNLGLNTIFNFSGSFNQDNCCRMCRATLDKMREMLEEKVELMRNPLNYTQDFQSRTIFDDLENFHITLNMTVDLMHDLLEGVAIYVMSAILTYYIFEKKYFSTAFLNTRIKKTKFYKEANTPPEIKVDSDKKSIKIKMSAAELKCFVEYFAFIIGDKIPKESIKDAEIWELYKLLRRIIIFVQSPVFTTASAYELKEIIKRHHEIYRKYFGDLKPKFHFLVHYPNILLKNGPFVNFWCMRGESYHTLLKAASNAGSGNKNSLLSIAIKEMLRLCYEKDSYIPPAKICFGKLDLSFCRSDIISSIEASVLENCEFYLSVEIQGANFKIGDILIVDIESTEITFGKIEKIIQSDKGISFTFKLYKEDYFDDDLNAYLVKEKKSPKTILFRNLPEFAPCSLQIKDKKMYIITPQIV